jgi:hypothetical protein
LVNNQGESWRVSGHFGGALGNPQTDKKEKGRSHARLSLTAQINPTIVDPLLGISGAKPATRNYE